MNQHSNDDLARLLHNNSIPKAPKSTNPPAEAAGRNPRAILDVGLQRWSLGTIGSQSQPVSERELRALFAALSKGTRERFGREPTVAELLNARNQINAARELVASAALAVSGTKSFYLESGRLVFND